jgi:hypothetical protein
VGEDWIYRDSGGYIIVSLDESSGIIYFNGSRPSTFASLTAGNDTIHGELE